MTAFLYAHGELIFCLCGIVWMMANRLKWRSLLCFVGYALFVAVFRSSHDMGISGTHVLAMAHILVSWAAKTAVCMAICAWLGEAWRGTGLLVRFGAGCMAASIILGMIWAFDAPGWGRLWQWDCVEIYALCLFVCLWEWQKRAANHDFWAFLCLMCLTCETLGLYGGFSPNSRHSYGAGAGDMWCAIGWMVCLGWICVCSKKKRWLSRRLSLRGQTAAWTLAGVAVMTFCGVEMHPAAMCVAFGLIWGLFNLERNATQIAVTVIGLLCLGAMCLDITPGEMVTARLDSPDSWKILGILPEKVGDCMQLEVQIASPASHEGFVRLETCSGGQWQPVSFADIWPEMRRVYASAYDALTGVALFVRNIAFERAFELVLLLLWGIGIVLGVKKCRTEAEENSHEKYLRDDWQAW